MEFQRSFLRRHFAGKPRVASRNFGCFLRVKESVSTCREMVDPDLKVREGPTLWSKQNSPRSDTDMIVRVDGLNSFIARVLERIL